MIWHILKLHFFNGFSQSALAESISLCGYSRSSSRDFNSQGLLSLSSDELVINRFVLQDTRLNNNNHLKSLFPKEVLITF